MPPKNPLKNKRKRLDFLFKNFFCFKKKGIKISIPKKFLKKACSTGCIKVALNFISAAKIENRKQDSIN